MSDDKDKKDSAKSDGTGSSTGTTDDATKVGFGELFGYIDERIKSALGKSSGTDGGKDTGTTDASGADPQDVAAQVRAELAKLSGEEASKKKDADRDVTIEELKTTVAKLTEEKPEEKLPWITEKMWGKRSKK